MVLNSLSFCLSVKLLISLSYLNETLAGYSNLSCRFFSFITLGSYGYSVLKISFSSLTFLRNIAIYLSDIVSLM